MTQPVTVTQSARDASARQYRKIALITATQWHNHGDHPAVERYTDQGGYVVKGIGPYGWVHTLEGGHLVSAGDWIATGIKGEHWPIKPDVFAATYEAVSDTPQDRTWPECLDPNASHNRTAREPVKHLTMKRLDIMSAEIEPDKTYTFSGREVEVILTLQSELAERDRLLKRCEPYVESAPASIDTSAERVALKRALSKRYRAALKDTPHD